MKASLMKTLAREINRFKICSELKQINLFKLTTKSANFQRTMQRYNDRKNPSSYQGNNDNGYGYGGRPHPNDDYSRPALNDYHRGPPMNDDGDRYGPPGDGGYNRDARNHYESSDRRPDYQGGSGYRPQGRDDYYRDQRQDDYRDSRRDDYRDSRRDDYPDQRRDDYRNSRRDDYPDQRRDDYRDQRRVDYRDDRRNDFQDGYRKSPPSPPTQAESRNQSYRDNRDKMSREPPAQQTYRDRDRERPNRPYQHQ